MARQFKREVKLTIAKPKGFFAQQNTNAIVITGLRMQFSIEKKLDKNPNTCDIIITNLSSENRGMLETKPHITLDAGYDGQTERLFAGDLIDGRSRQVDADWETTIQVSDGARAYAFARVNRSFPAGIKLRDCLRDVAKSLNLNLPALVGPEFDRQFANGVSLHGTAQREMSRLLKPYGFIWSVQDGRLQILRPEETRKDLATLISQDTGMIGSPELGPPDTKGKPPVLFVSTRLKPSLTPGSLIKVESRQHNGAFKLSRVKHVGDTHGDVFDSTLEGESI